MGTVIDRLPTPIPVMNRPARMELWAAEVTDVHWMITPRMKTPVLRMMQYFREMISARKPEYSVPSHAPSSRMAVSHPFLPPFVTQSPISARLISRAGSRTNNPRAERTIAKRRHNEDAGENTLVVTIEETTETGEASNTEHSGVLQQSSGSSFTSQLHTPLQSSLVELGGSTGRRHRCK